LEEQHKAFFKKIEQLESERESLMGRQKRDKESLEIELEEKKHVIKRYESEFKEANSQKIFMKKQLDEYESKIKKLIKEFEDESKKHINEIKDLHDHYRGYKTTSFELE